MRTKLEVVRFAEVSNRLANGARNFVVWKRGTEHHQVVHLQGFLQRIDLHVREKGLNDQAQRIVRFGDPR